MLPTRQSPEQLVNAIVGLTDNNGELDPGLMMEAIGRVTAHDAEVRAETLTQAATLMDTHIDYPCDREEEISNSIFSYARNEILALSPDPHYRERIKLKERIAEAKWWSRNRYDMTSPCASDKLGPKGVERIADLESKLATLDAPKGEE